MGTCQILDQQTGDSVPFSPCRAALVETDYKDMNNSETLSRPYSGPVKAAARTSWPHQMCQLEVQWLGSCPVTGTDTTLTPHLVVSLLVLLPECLSHQERQPMRGRVSGSGATRWMF